MEKAENDFSFFYLYCNITLQLHIMGITKNHIFDDYQNETASITKVLGHPARIAILQYISQNEYCNCNDLVKATGLAQPTVSQHLSEIKRIKILTQKQQGKIYFTLSIWIYGINIDEKSMISLSKFR